MLFTCRDFNMIEEHMLSPVVDALGPIANITVESQVLDLAFLYMYINRV